jgi:quercetin dioxygenase-like cupin family protein
MLELYPHLNKLPQGLVMKTKTLLLTLFLSTALFAQEQVVEGVIPNISDHYAASPTLYHFEQMPIEKISDGITRQYIYGAQSQLVKWVFQKNAVVPLHHHVNEQITWITQGSVKVFSQGKTYIMHAGDVMVIPPNVPHEFIALEDNTIDIDVFTPARQDWIDGKANYLKNIPSQK